ncbi:hypothetical protein A9Y87_10275 [Salmonella enterica subsp. enterica]|nr:hypothetical protein A9Y87_10275 [Salmonella enterica subsp. enterica]
MLDMIARSMERFGKKIRQRAPANALRRVKTEFLIFTLDTTRAQDELGYQPIVTLDEGIERTAAWLRDHGNLPR